VTVETFEKHRQNQNLIIIECSSQDNQIDMVERKTWSTAARHTRVVSATRRCCSVMYNFICHQTFHTNINQLTHQQQQQHYLFQCTNTSNCHCTATELLPSLVWCHFSHGQAGQQNVSIILVTPLTLNMHFETM